MIRFVHIGDQITDCKNDFAWYDTVTDSFCEFNGEQVFSTWAEFEHAASNSLYQDPTRFRALFPANRI